MIYKENEIRKMMGKITSPEPLSDKDRCIAADMMDDMLYALGIWDSYSGLLATHGCMPLTKEASAQHWNRPQDKDNTRVWE